MSNTLLCIASVLSFCVFNAAPGSVFGQSRKLTSTVTVSPKSVREGATYWYHLDIHNGNSSEARVEAQITSYPSGDSLLSKGWKYKWIGAGKTLRFSFLLRAGRTAGRITSQHKAVFSNQCRYWVGDKGIFRDHRQKAVYRQFKNHHKTRSIKFLVYKRGSAVGTYQVAAPGQTIRIWVGRLGERIAWENLPWTCKWSTP